MSSGTIRRIDDLGRIVFPREVRRMLGIHERLTHLPHELSGDS